MATTAVATTATTHGEVHGTKAMAQAMSFQAQGKPARAAQIQREPNALPSRAQASHSRAPHIEQPTPVA